VLDFVGSVLEDTPEFGDEEHLPKLAHMLLGQEGLGVFC
jgi:hypothetical protein